MQELDEIAKWFAQSEIGQHRFAVSTTLPSPTFMQDGREFVSFSTNNYLAMTKNPGVIQAAKNGLDRYGAGNCESRLLGGDIDVYHELESYLARFVGKEASIIFATGYLTNIGALGSLVRGAQLARLYGFKPQRAYRYTYFTDEYNHISITDGIRLSGADKVIYRHCDLNELEERLRKATDCEKVIVTDGIFSQDGDIVPLPEMMALAEKYDATVFVDDAHGFGILGEHGAGVAQHFGIQSDRLIYMASLSKAVGVIGGFVATDAATVQALRLGSPAYGFTASILPDQAMAVLASLKILEQEPERRRQLWANQRYFVEKVRAMGFRLVSDQSPILPILVGDEKLGDEMAAKFLAAGIYVDAVKFPAVAIHQCRLRFMMNAHHTREQIDRVLDILSSMESSYVDPGPLRPVVRKTLRPSRKPGDPVAPGLQSIIFAEIQRIAREEFDITSPIDPEHHLRMDLNLDSMALIILSGTMQESFGVPLNTPEALEIETVRDLIEYVARHKEVEDNKS